MAESDTQPSTGLAGLDRALGGLMPGDSIVWQVDSVDDYRPFVEPYCRGAVRNGQRLIYFRFARHRPLADADSGVAVKLNANTMNQKVVCYLERAKCERTHYANRKP